MSVKAVILMSEKLGDGGWWVAGWVVFTEIKDWSEPINNLLFKSLTSKGKFRLKKFWHLKILLSGMATVAITTTFTPQFKELYRMRLSDIV